MKLLPVLALGATLLAPVAANAQDSFGIKGWPAVGMWVVMREPSGTGRAVCAAITKAKKPYNNAANYAMAIRMDAVDTKLLVFSQGLPAPPPDTKEIAIVVDGQRLVTAQVTEAKTDAKGTFTLVADLPGDTLARQMLPAMSHGSTLNIIAGLGTVYSMPIQGFPKVVDHLRACAQEMATMMGITGR